MARRGETNFSIYPNPTPGNFVLEQKGEKLFSKILVEVYSMLGEKVMSETIVDEKQHVFRFSGMTSGLYILNIIADGHLEAIKVVKF
ncbi:MAG: T9SS type A sorting domain-containing protein [Bacteroidales bacterium]|nr:T9SS type A sorting domain-containing protein [Bacteroidales bacterium]